MNPFEIWLGALAIASGIMILTWLVAMKIDNYGIVDAVWAASFLAVALWFSATLEGAPSRDALVLNVIGAWSLRLAVFLGRRLARHHPEEDHRYQKLRAEYGTRVRWRFFWFYQYQAWSVVLLSAPAYLMLSNPDLPLRPVELVGAGLFLIALFGESVADAQKQAFYADPVNRGRVCETGLWRFSRHPNYFFESCIWISLGLMCLGSPQGWIALYCPLLIVFLLLKITGVPLAEEHALRTRGELYRAYQKRVSKFVPWVRGSAASGLAVAIVTAGSLLALAPVKSRAEPAAASVPTERRARIYELGQTSGAPLFTQVSRYEKLEGGRVRSITQVLDRDQKPVITETAVIQGFRMVSQTMEQFQSQQVFELEMRDDKAYFRSHPMDAPKKIREAHEYARENFITGPAMEPFIRAKWDDLLNGKTVPCDFGVFELREAVAFELKFVGRERSKGRESVIIEMKPASFLINLLVNPIRISFDEKERRYLKLTGRTPLLKTVEGEQKPFDAEVIFD